MNPTKDTHRAPAGGIVAQNGEFYAGGTFLPLGEGPKGTPKASEGQGDRLEAPRKSRRLPTFLPLAWYTGWSNTEAYDDLSPTCQTVLNALFPFHVRAHFRPREVAPDTATIAAAVGMSEADTLATLRELAGGGWIRGHQAGDVPATRKTVWKADPLELIEDDW